MRPAGPEGYPLRGGVGGISGLGRGRWLDRLYGDFGRCALPYVRAVKVWRSIGDAYSLGEAVWKFRIEETLPPESSEGAAVTEPFTLTVTRGSRSEAYSQCTLTYHRCELDAGALRRIRQGVAGSRSVNG